MPTPGELIEAISDILHIPAATVFQHDRVLVEAGFRQAAGRGRNSSVTPQDAANLIIAIVGAPPFGPTVKESAATLRKYGRLPARKVPVDLEAGSWPRAMPKLKAGHSFVSALGEIIECFAAGRFNTALTVWPDLKRVVTHEIISQVASDPLPMRTSQLPVGEWDPGTIDVSVMIEWPVPSAEIEISGRISLPFPDQEVERVKYFSVPRTSKFIRVLDLTQQRSFTEETLKPISSLFKQLTKADQT